MENKKITKSKIPLIIIVLISAVLNFVNLNKEGYGNEYYAAAVKSMTMSFKNFFFAAFDPSGFVSIDKPPVGFWLQAISAKIFGYYGWSIILPQAIAGVLCVILIYFIVKSSFGERAGLISSLCLAITPVFVATSRNNTVDNVLLLMLLLACWFISKAAERGSLKLLLLCMLFVGIGFNVKMLQAYMIIPAVYLTYLLCTAVSIKKRIIHLVLSTVILLGVSFSWALIVDSIPASQRPFVDSSTNNTVMELIIGHNGIERLEGNQGQGGGPGGIPGNFDSNRPDGGMRNIPYGDQQGLNRSNAQQNTNNAYMQVPPDMNGNANGNMQPPPNMDGNAGGNMQQPPDWNGKTDGNRQMGMGGPNASGGLQGSFGAQVTAGISRLFVKSVLSDQIIWFIPIAIIGFIAAAFKEKLTFRLDNRRKQALVLWFMWFLPEFIFFSWTTGTFHPYYLTMLAPPIAALTGIGIVSMWELYKEKGWKSWFLPAALLANTAVQLLMLYYFISYSEIVKVLMVAVIVVSLISSIVLAVLNLRNRQEQGEENNIDTPKLEKTVKLKYSLAAIAFAGLLLTPLTGSAEATVYKLSSSFPTAGLELLSGNMNMEGNMANTVSSSLVDFLLKNKTDKQKYLLVVGSSSDGADIIIKTGEPVMSLGGFLGSDNIITLDEFKSLVQKGEIRYVMAGSRGGGGNSNSEIMNWVKSVGTEVSSTEYSGINVNSSGTEDLKTKSYSNENTNSNTQDQAGRQNGMQGMQQMNGLYDLKPYTDSLNK